MKSLTLKMALSLGALFSVSRVSQICQAEDSVVSVKTVVADENGTVVYESNGADDLKNGVVVSGDKSINIDIDPGKIAKIVEKRMGNVDWGMIKDSMGPGGWGSAMRMGGPGFGMNWAGKLDEAGLIEFLKKNDPPALLPLSQAKKQGQEQYEDALNQCWEIYGPIIRIMQNNPEKGNLMVKKIRVNRKIQKILDDDKDKNKLRVQLSQLFEIIYGLEKIDLQETQQWLERTSSRMQKMNEMASNQNQKTSNKSDLDPNSKEGKRQKFFQSMRAKIQPYMEKQNKRMQKQVQQKLEELKNWRKNRNLCINQRIEQLLKSANPFPWQK